MQQRLGSVESTAMTEVQDSIPFCLPVWLTPSVFKLYSFSANKSKVALSSISTQHLQLILQQQCYSPALENHFSKPKKICFWRDNFLLQKRIHIPSLVNSWIIRVYLNFSSKSDLFWEDLLTVTEEAGIYLAKGKLGQSPRSKKCRNKGCSEECIKIF